MKIKLIAIDLDGTLLQHDHTVSEENIKAINEAMSNNVEIVICTGRVFNEIPKQVKDIKGINYFITSNGARIFDKDKNTVFQNTIPKNIADEIMLLLKKYDCIIDLYLNGDSYYPKLTDELIDKHQISEEFI
ncbi:MAG: HAD family phosphatase, partial [Clostridiales bacterium]|nr:HAD family phosphatase [Clostridiales bacterium]